MGPGPPKFGKKHTPAGRLGKKRKKILGGGVSQIFFGIFTPKIGEDEPIWTNIFQMGWFNHQLESGDSWIFP